MKQQYQRKKHFWMEKIESLAIRFNGVPMKVSTVLIWRIETNLFVLHLILMG
jgi:hypothetical protein